MDDHRTSLKRIVIGLAIALVAVLGFLAFSLWLGQATGQHEGSSELGCATLVVLGLAGLSLWARVARSAFSEARLEVLAPASPGGLVTARLVLEPKRPLTLVPGESSVLVVTRKDVGDETSRVFEERRPLQLPQHLVHRHQQRLEFQLPPGVPLTSTSAGRAKPRSLVSFLTSPPERYSSELQVIVAIERWPDLVLSAPLEVCSPSSAAAVRPR